MVKTTKTNLYILIPCPSGEYINETFLIFVRMASQFYNWSIIISRDTWKRKSMLVCLYKSKCGRKIPCTGMCVRV